MNTQVMKSFRVASPSARSVIARNKKISKIDINKQGLNKVKKVDPAVFQNLAGISSTMEKKDFVDPSGKKGKGLGVYRFQSKYGANVDGYSPIYTPDVWSQSGDTYALGTKGLLAWAGLVLVLLLVGVNLIVATSAVP